jgi:hypothetical protein
MQQLPLSSGIRLIHDVIAHLSLFPSEIVQTSPRSLPRTSSSPTQIPLLSNNHLALCAMPLCAGCVHAEEQRLVLLCEELEEQVCRTSKLF